MVPRTSVNATPDQLLDRIAVALRGNLPPGISPAYLDGFLARHRRTLVGVLERELGARRARSGADERRVPLTDAPPELWTPAQRTAANLAAMRVAASTPPDQLTADDRRTLAVYSGWGGLSIDKVRDRFPAGFPAPEARGLIREYYTPTGIPVSSQASTWTSCEVISPFIRPTSQRTGRSWSRLVSAALTKALAASSSAS